MALPTEQVGSIPRPLALLDAIDRAQRGELSGAALAGAYDAALRDTIERLEATGSPVISDGEQTKPSFATYPLAGLESLSPEGVEIPFEDGHVRRLPAITEGPFRYQVYSESFLRPALGLANVPVKQAVISASAMSLLYPPHGLEGYPQEEFNADVVAEVTRDIRGSLDAGAHNVQMDFTEGRLALKLDPTGGLLRAFIGINNAVFANFGERDRSRLGVHTCPGGDHDAAHSSDVDYAGLLPSLFGLDATNFYIQLASEADPDRVLGIIGENIRPGQRAFIGVIDPINPELETPGQVRDRILRAAEHIPLDQLGTTDDCGFSPFADDISTARDLAFAKISVRVEGTALAAAELGV